MKTTNHPFQSRIAYKGELKILIDKVIDLYKLDKYKDHLVIEVGYEDFNIKLTTSKKNYLLKFFADFRNKEECLRYVDIMSAAIKAGIQHPKLYKSSQGYFSEINIDNTKTRLVVIDFIDGKNFYELKIKPSPKEQEFIIKQVVKINQLQIKPKYLYDSWAAVNFVKEYENIKNKLSAEDKKNIEPIYEEFKKSEIKSLPRCFVHGDIIDTNVIKEKNSGNLYILDFAVSNIYPRIQELAILLCDILFDYKNKDCFINTYNKTLIEYQKTIALTQKEITLLPLFIKVCHAMHIIGATKANVEEGLNEENEHWLNMGRQGLEFSKEFKRTL
jgi:Ser/Thr protein kinase RdoA (MazF antagonist)